MAAGMVRVEGAGYPVILTFHDEIVSERPENTGSLDEFVSLMTALLEWRTGFPLKAAGWHGCRARKRSPMRWRPTCGWEALFVVAAHCGACSSGAGIYMEIQ